MNFNFVLHKIYAQAVKDKGFADKKAEYYQTWQVCELETLNPNDENPDAKWARQGYSLLGSPGGGAFFLKEQERTINDPIISFDLPNLAEGESRMYRLDMHFWESDGNSEKVREVFHDETLDILVQSFNANGGDLEKAGNDVKDWLNNEGKGVLDKTLEIAHVGANPLVGLGMKVLPLFAKLTKLAIETAKKDDYMGRHRFIMDYQSSGPGTYRWRIFPIGGGHELPEFMTEEGTMKSEVFLADNSNANRMDVNYEATIF